MQARTEKHRDPDTPTTPSRDPFSVPTAVKATIRVLVVEDDRALREGISGALRLDGYDVNVASSGADATHVLAETPFDIVLTELNLASASGLHVLRSALAAKHDAIVIVSTDNPTVSASIEVMRAGAWEYLPKPFSATHLQILLGRAAHHVVQSRQMHTLHAQLRARAALVGGAPAFQQAVTLATRVAPTDASVFLVGESGTGKEMFANFIHQHSRRANRSLAAINCGALPEPLLESELFGSRPASAAAGREKSGLLEAADQSTLFLDEVTDMPPGLQARLLRVLQDGVVRRVGSQRMDAVVDIRFISATTTDPEQESSARLRADLLYRLRVVSIRIPPLRERRDDIPLLAAHFVNHFWQRHQRAGTSPPKLTRDVMEYLRARPWPGNVRELQNVVEQAVILAEPGQSITAATLPSNGEPDPATAISRTLTPETLSEGFHPAKEKLVSEFERIYLSRLVSRAGGNMARAARLANIDRTTLYRLVEKHHLACVRDAPETET